MTNILNPETTTAGKTRPAVSGHNKNVMNNLALDHAQFMQAKLDAETKAAELEEGDSM